LCFCCTILKAVIQLLYILEIDSKFHKKVSTTSFLYKISKDIVTALVCGHHRKKI